MASRAGNGKRRYFTEARREQYLDNLRRTANHESAAREAGLSPRAARRFRQRDPAFAARCAAAEEEAQRRLADAPDERGGASEPAFESIRRGPDGRLKIQARGRRRWSKRAEDRFFDVLRETGNIRASARAAGVSREAVWKRRRAWPAFARRFEEAMEEAEIALEFRVACIGTNWSEAADQADERAIEGEDGAEDPGEGGEAEADSGGAAAAPPFDPELALRFLKWRAERKRGGGEAAALPSAEEARASILRKVDAIIRHEAREKARRAEHGE